MSSHYSGYILSFRGRSNVIHSFCCHIFYPKQMLEDENLLSFHHFKLIWVSSHHSGVILSLKCHSNAIHSFWCHSIIPDSFQCDLIILMSFPHSKVIPIVFTHSHVIPLFQTHSHVFQSSRCHFSHSIVIQVILQSLCHSHIICHHYNIIM